METQMLAGAYAAIGLLFIAATTWLLREIVAKAAEHAQEILR